MIDEKTDMQDMTEGTHADDPLMILTFRIKGERFALTVQHVNEILDPIPETPVPNAPAWAPSLVNVRGNVVPMFDIRHRLGLGKAEHCQTARIVVLDVMIENDPTRLAVLVEAVEDVIEADLEQFETIPDLGARWPAQFIDGVADHGGDLVVLLNTNALFHVTSHNKTAA